MAEGRKLNTVETVNTLAASDRLVTVRTADGHTVQISLTDFMNTLPAGSIITATVGDEQITNAKLEKRAALSVMGNATNATDAPADITAGSDNTVLKRDGNSLVFDEVKAADIDMSDLISSLISAGAGVSVSGRISSAGSVALSHGPLSITCSRTSTGVYEVTPQAGYSFVAFTALAESSSPYGFARIGTDGETWKIGAFSESGNAGNIAFRFIAIMSN